MLRRTCETHWLKASHRPLIQLVARPTLLRHYVYPEQGVFQPDSPPRDQTIRQPTRIASRFPSPPQYQPQPPPPPPRRSRFIPRWTTVFSAFFFTSIGLYFTHAILDVFTPAIPGSEEDAEDLALLAEEFDELRLVQQLRDTWRVVDGVRQPAYTEWVAYEGIPSNARRAERLTTGPLAGSAGVAAQRVFYNEEQGQLFLFINFGPRTTGWPTVVHGGAIATIADEALGRFVVRRTVEKTGVTAHLEVNYLQTVNPGQWFVWIVGFDPEKQNTDKKKYVQGMLACCSPEAPTLEGMDMMNVHTHATAKALFVVPRNLGPLVPIPDNF